MPRLHFLLSATILCSAFAPAQAQVYKCIESGGATTYQQTPCRAGQKGGALDIRTDNGSGNDGPAAESEWAAAIQQRAPRQGMPQRLVEQALGPPQETRPPRPGERATASPAKRIWPPTISSGWNWRTASCCGAAPMI